MPDGSVIAAGTFTAVNGAPANNTARWNGGTNWSSLGSGVDAGVFALTALPSGGVAVGGYFSNAGGQPSPSMAA